MNTMKMSEEIICNRRSFLRDAAMTIAATQLGATGIEDNLPQEAPQAFTEAVVEVDGY